MKKALKWVIISLFVIALVAGGTLLWELTGQVKSYTGSVVIEIEPGTGTPEVARLLAERGVIHYPSAFVVLAELGRLGYRSLKAGEYLFDRPLSPLAVYRKIVHGDVYLHTLVIPEGSDRFEIAHLVQEQLRIDPDDFLRATLRTEHIEDLDPQAPTLEGYLFPDTYRFPRGTSAASVVARMLARFRQVIDIRFPPELHQSPEQLHQVLTLASLVEKETPQPGERPMIAGVFLRRLDAHMPLQCDPTVVYAVRLRDKPQGVRWERAISITRGELELDSAYNTYLHAGLPPGPICSPGAASIAAALNPAAGRSLYFVSNNHGGHVFSATLDEHQRNVAHYRSELAEEQRQAAELGASLETPAELPVNGDKILRDSTKTALTPMVATPSRSLGSTKSRKGRHHGEHQRHIPAKP